MRFISWNVNGLRACLQKGFLEVFDNMDADFFCLQETKLQEGQIALDLPGYEQYWCYAEKKGYSGTAIFTKHTPLSVTYGMGIPELDTEGRLITLEYKEFYLVTCYTPNAQRGLARIEHRLKWEESFCLYLMELDSKKPVILCGDLNVAHKEIDLKNPGSNRGNAGFSDEERDCFTKLLSSGFTDTFRHLHPDTTGAYTWWSYMFNARQNNAGWRIDYFLVSDRLKENIFSTPIYPEILGSDHCPVGLDIDLLCNGGIWSPEKAGEAKQILTENKKSPPIRSAVIGSAILCLLLVSGLLVLLGLPGEKTTLSAPTEPVSTEPDPTVEDLRFSPLYNDLLSIHEYTEPLSIVRAAFDPLSSRLDTYITDGEYYWRIDVDDGGIPIEQKIRESNCWLRIQLTDLGKNTIREDAELALYCYALLYGSTQDQVYYPQPLDAELDTLCYYDADGSFAGWFIYGTIPQTLELHIHIPTGLITGTIVTAIAMPYTGSESTTPT